MDCYTPLGHERQEGLIVRREDNAESTKTQLAISNSQTTWDFRNRDAGTTVHSTGAGRDTSLRSA